MEWYQIQQDLELTDREMSIVFLLSSGFDNSEIVKEIKCVTGTVKRNIGSIGRKLGIDPGRFMVSIRIVYLCHLLRSSPYCSVWDSDVIDPLLRLDRLRLDRDQYNLRRRNWRKTPAGRAYARDYRRRKRTLLLLQAEALLIRPNNGAALGSSK